MQQGKLSQFFTKKKSEEISYTNFKSQMLSHNQIEEDRYLSQSIFSINPSLEKKHQSVVFSPLKQKNVPIKKEET